MNTTLKGLVAASVIAGAAVAVFGDVLPPPDPLRRIEYEAWQQHLFFWGRKERKVPPFARGISRGAAAMPQSKGGFSGSYHLKTRRSNSAATAKRSALADCKARALRALRSNLPTKSKCCRRGYEVLVEGAFAAASEPARRPSPWRNEGWIRRRQSPTEANRETASREAGDGGKGK